MPNNFILFGRPPANLSTNYTEVLLHDPIRGALSTMPSFEKAIEKICEGDYENYSFFVETRNPVNGRIHNQTNLFFERDRRFTCFSGPFAGVQLQPIPPIRVYRRVRNNSTKRSFINDKRIWLTENILSKILLDRTDTIRFVAGEHSRDVMVHPMIYKELRIAEDDNVVPLLVMSSAKHSLDFAEFVLGLIHCCSETEIKEHFQKNQALVGKLSIDRLRKIYDIFPEEFLQIPHHVWNHLKSIDNYELTSDDVQELSSFYKNL